MEGSTAVMRSYPIDDPSRISEVRRAAATLARQESLDETRTGNLALIVTELSTNLLKHAQGGEVFLSPLSEGDGAGVEVLALDRGPGMSDVERCLKDGYSSAQTSGTGLGAVSRLSQEFDIYSEPGKGTAVVAQVRGDGQRRTAFGAVVKPMKGEDLSGDAWACTERNNQVTMIVADGLGHGILAAEASTQAIVAFHDAQNLAPDALLRNVHEALRKTRGAAVAVTQLDRTSGEIKFAGIGNISAVISDSAKSQFMVSHSGTAGYGAPRIQMFSYMAPESALIVMHSDGLTSSWNVEDHAGLRKHHPTLIAGVLYRDATRHRDDACVVVAKLRSAV